MKNLQIGKNKSAVSKKTFELTVYVRDNNGNLTNHSKTIATDDPVKLSYFWNRYAGAKKKRRKKVDAAVNTKDIKHAVNEANKYADKINQNKETVL